MTPENPVPTPSPNPAPEPVAEPVSEAAPVMAQDAPPVPLNLAAPPEETNAPATVPMPTATKPKVKLSKRTVILISSIAGSALVVILAVVIIIGLINNKSAEEVVTHAEVVERSTKPETPTIDETTEDIPEGMTVVAATDLKPGTVEMVVGGERVTYKAAYVVDGVYAVAGSGTYTSDVDSQNVFLVINGGVLKTTGSVKITKAASYRNEPDQTYTDFGVNSAIAVIGEKSELRMTSGEIKSETAGANAVYVAEGATASLKNLMTNSTKENSRGVVVAYGASATIDAAILTTKGQNSPAVAALGGETKILATNLNLSTTGLGSQLLALTGDNEIRNSSGTASGAQAMALFGQAKVDLESCKFSANGHGNKASNADNSGILIYQGNEATLAGEVTLTASNSEFSTLASSPVYASSPLFLVANSNANIVLKNVKANFSKDNVLVNTMSSTLWGKFSTTPNVVFTTEKLTATNTEMKGETVTGL